MDILALLKEGVSTEEITAKFFDSLSLAHDEYEEWKKEQEEKAKAAAARKMEQEFKKQRQDLAREALGAAIVNYFEALDIKVTEQTMVDVDLIIEVLPKLKVIKSGSWRGIW